MERDIKIPASVYKGDPAMRNIINNELKEQFVERLCAAGHTDAFED